MHKRSYFGYIPATAPTFYPDSRVASSPLSQQVRQHLLLLVRRYHSVKHLSCRGTGQSTEVTVFSVLNSTASGAATYLGGLQPYPLHSTWLTPFLHKFLTYLFLLSRIHPDSPNDWPPYAQQAQQSLEDFLKELLTVEPDIARKLIKTHQQVKRGAGFG